MPAVSIEIRREYTYRQEMQLIEAVAEAMTECLHIPLENNNIRLFAHAAHRFTVPPNKDDRYTLISIDLFEGRSMETKRQLFQRIVGNLGQFDIPADHIKIVLRENARENWAIRGGIPACEVELGYEVNI